jgi:molybdopterin molybdotransferase
MLSVDEALAMVLARAEPLAAQTLSVADAVGRVLAEEIASDIDSPPYDKSTVDGFAVRAADIAGGRREFHVVEEVTAGGWPQRIVGEGQATRIMTGAPLPSGADAVVMVEHTAAGRWNNSTSMQLTDRPVRVGQNIFRRAQSLTQGQIVLRAGQVLRPIEVGLLSEVGRAVVRVIPRPRVAVLATGDELVSPHETPGRGQIRNSNGPMLQALAARAGGQPIDLGVARDQADDLRERIGRGLDADLLVLSGGVSAGVLDLVPRILEEQGVERRFHQVHMRPGKPLWFGERQESGRRTLVFGLPGNPVSSLVCWELFAKPALARLQGLATETEFAGGIESSSLTTFTGVLDAAHQQRGDRPTYWPAFAMRSRGESSLRVRLLNWQGSADLRTLTEANCLVYFPPGDRSYSQDEQVSLRWL